MPETAEAVLEAPVVEATEIPAVETPIESEAQVEVEEPAKVETKVVTPDNSLEIKAAKGTIKEMQEELSKQLSSEGKQKLQALGKTFDSLQKQNAELVKQTHDLRYVREAHRVLKTEQAEVNKNLETTDSLLYGAAENPAQAKTLAENICDDILEHNKDLKSAGALAGALLDKLQESNSDSYGEIQRSMVRDAVKTVGLDTAVQSLIQAFNSGNGESLKATVVALRDWLKGLQSDGPEEKTDAKAKPEVATSPEQRKIQTEVTTTANSDINKTLGGFLKPIFASPEFKALGLNREGLVDLGTVIRNAWITTLNKDKKFQAAMNAEWSKPKPDAAKLRALHTAKLSAVGKFVVDVTVDRRYPHWKSAASSTAKPVAKPTVKTKQETHSRFERNPKTGNYVFIKGGK